MLRDLSELIKKRADLLTEARALEYRIEKQRTAALAALPASFGYSDLGSFIRAVKDAAKPARKAKATRRTSKPIQRTPQAARLAAVQPAPPPAAYPGLAAAKTPDSVKPPLPTGTSLDDPANFGMLPDTALLERGIQSRESFIDSLGQALRFAQKILHTSKVPARVWWEWRQFERSAIEAIQAAKDAERDNSV